LLVDKTHLLLLDCDIAFAAPLDLAVVCRNGLCGRIVGYPNPPMDVWAEILLACGLTSAATVRTAFDPAGLTPCENLNGGVLSFPTALLMRLMPRWNAWADWVVAHSGLLGSFAYYTDQISLALALMEMRLSPCPLPLEYNLAWGAPESLLSDLAEVVLLHYHDSAAGGRLLYTGRSLDAVIRRINTLSPSAGRCGV
jgi:hypothetical protein